MSTMRRLIMLAVVVLVSGCLNQEWLDKQDLVFYKGIESAQVPPECGEETGNVCMLFDCMVDRCWCHETTPGGPILREGSAVVEDEADAAAAVGEYLVSVDSDYTVQRAVKLNTVFYNVFTEDEAGLEETYTVAADGTIIQTACGV